MVNEKNGNLKRKILVEKRINTSLKDISVVLNNHGCHGLLSFLGSSLNSGLLN